MHQSLEVFLALGRIFAEHGPALAVCGGLTNQVAIFRNSKYGARIRNHPGWSYSGTKENWHGKVAIERGSYQIMDGFFAYQALIGRVASLPTSVLFSNEDSPIDTMCNALLKFTPVEGIFPIYLTPVCNCLQSGLFHRSHTCV